MKQRVDAEIKDRIIMKWNVDVGDVEELMQEDLQKEVLTNVNF